jgi:hypothetical protein
MIEISERITRVTMSSDAALSPLEGAGPSRLPRAARAPTGARVTLDFSRTRPLTDGEVVRLRYDFAGDGNLRECAGIAWLTHTVERPGHLVVFHYRLSHWITPSMLAPIREKHAPAVE